jgi:AbrB family looped-hinge helix DNA binding protein
MFKGIKLYGSTTIGSKGQVVIPAEAREELGLNDGQRVVVLRSPRGEGVVIMRAEAVEGMLTEIQDQMGKMSDSIKKLKDMK